MSGMTSLDLGNTIERDLCVHHQGMRGDYFFQFVEQKAHDRRCLVL
jgi:hypothetical protein